MPNTTPFDSRVAAFQSKVPAHLAGLAAELQRAFYAAAKSQFSGGGGSGFGNSGDKLQSRSGTLLESFRPGKEGNATTVVNRDGILQMSIGSDVVYARIHEDGGFIRSKGKMEGYLMAKYMETGEKGFLYSSLAVKRDGGITIPARPFMAPAAAVFQVTSADIIERSLNHFVTRAFA